MPSSIRRIDVAGRDVTEYMQLLFRKSGYVFHTSAEKEVVRSIKEKCGYVAMDPKKEEKEWAQLGGRMEGKVVEYILPDGNKMKVRYSPYFSFPKAELKALQIGPERYRAPEILFDPEIIGLEYPGIHQIVVDAINRTDMDLRKSLFGNIVLSGGSTLAKGFGDRLLHEVQRLAVKDMRIKIFAPPERKYSTWIGGSILAGLSTFRKVSFIALHAKLVFTFLFFCFLGREGRGKGNALLTKGYIYRCGLILMIGMKILRLYIRNLIKFRYPPRISLEPRVWHVHQISNTFPNQSFPCEYHHLNTPQAQLLQISFVTHYAISGLCRSKPV